ncbi:hypothetical protein F5884DRAFT_237501 [Xylogone sp. PMI_703]|nr:hypothetical protein F5884DRAFT_237501 [Xylogone sp. PMI_703]
MSPDTSPYPDRPIRPLPKRRLRERLSPDFAESIKYPPAPKTTTPLFYYPYNLRNDTLTNGISELQHSSERERADDIERNYISRRNGEELESDEDELAYRSHIYSRASETPTRSYRYVQRPDSKNVNPQPPLSTTSSVDGYDSFENTNNKKKRKIPTPGESSLNGIHLSNDLTGLGVSSNQDESISEEVVTGSGSYHSPGVQGISGAGRGRYGRIRNGRSPLRTLSDTSGNWGNGRTPKQRQPQWPSPAENTGIISSAMANAEKIPITPSRGQENISLLQQQASKRPAPASTQFTFTCEPQIPGAVSWPAPNSGTNISPNQAATRTTSTHATQTSPVSASVNAPPVVSHTKKGLPTSQQNPNTQKQAPPPTTPTKKPRRRTGKEYLIAARQRRQQQEYQNYHHPPAPEDIWICEFCEYERIFGTPPEALIKQYEIKDRRLRKQEAERRRLLEKAKMKGRKGKKSNKAAAKTTPNTGDRQSQHPQAQPTGMNQSQSQSQGTQSEEFYEDDYDDDEYVQEDQNGLSPSESHMTNHEILQPDTGPRVTTQGGGIQQVH